MRARAFATALGTVLLLAAADATPTAPSTENAELKAEARLSGTPASDAKKPTPLVVRVTGSGRSLLLIPGLANGSNVWDATVAHFADRYACHVVTIAGFAGQPAIGELSWEQVRNSLIKYIRDHKLQRPVIIGHSMGGCLALAIASNVPDEVGPIISVDAVPFRFQGMTLAQARRQGEAVGEQYRQKTQEEFAKIVRSVLREQIQDPKEAERVAQQAVQSDPRVVGGFIADVTDQRDQVRAIRTPVLLLGQTYKDPDPQAKEKWYRSQLAVIPQHKLVMAPKAGHYIQLNRSRQ